MPRLGSLLVLAALAAGAQGAPEAATKKDGGALQDAILEKYEGILRVRNATDALLEPLTAKAAAVKAQVNELYTNVKTPPDVAAAVAAFKNQTVDAKLLAAEVVADVARAKKDRLDAKLPVDPFCKAVGQCADPAVTSLNQSINLLSAYLTVNVDNMGPNPIGAEVAAANGVQQAPINDNTSNNTQRYCTTKNITDYVTGHYRKVDNTTGLLLDVYTEWISVGLGDVGGTCQRDSDVGPSCAVVCARRGMACNPCAMSAVTNFNSFSWAVTQAGLSNFVNICRPPPGYDMAQGGGTGYFGYLCGTTDQPGAQDENFVLYSCNIPDYGKLVQSEAYTDACQVPTWRVGRDVFAEGFVGAQGGALCYCSGSSIVPPD